MKRRDAAEVQAWAALAASDLRVAGAVFAMSPPEWHQVCFHAQQAAEKSFKALLEAGRLPVPRTHDLVVLVDLLLGQHADLADLAESAAFLAEFAVGPRYPAMAGVATAEQASLALAEARRIVDRVDAILAGL